MNTTMKLHVQNTISLVSPPSSAKQQRQMSIFQALQRTRLCAVKYSLENSELNNNGKTLIILQIGKFTGRKLFLIAANEKEVKIIHFPSHAVLEVTVAFTQIP